MRIPYYYRIQDTVTGIYYVGSKYGADANPELFWKEGGYFTSSEVISEIIEKHGPERFRVVKVIPMNSAYVYETRLLQKINAKAHPMFYNNSNNHKLSYGTPEFEHALIEKYGTANIQKIESVVEKRRKSLNEKYGVDAISPLSIKQIHNKTMKTRAMNGTNIFETNNPMKDPVRALEIASKRSGENHYTKKNNYYYTIDGEWILLNTHKQQLSDALKEVGISYATYMKCLTKGPDWCVSRGTWKGLRGKKETT